LVSGWGHAVMMVVLCSTMVVMMWDAVGGLEALEGRRVVDWPVGISADGGNEILLVDLVMVGLAA